MQQTKTQIFYNSSEFNKLWNQLQVIGSLSEGECRRFNKQTVIKKLYECKYDEDYFLKFKDLNMKVYIFAKKVIYIDKVLNGYTSKYFNGDNLSFINKNNINFEELINGCKEVYEDNYILSKKGIESYDVPFNILYKKGHFGIVDTCDYKETDKDSKELYEKSIKIFNNAILEFLVKSTFYDFVKSSKELSTEYKAAENGSDIGLYIELLKRKLGEYMGKEIKYIRDAKEIITTSEDCLYPELLIEEEIDYLELDYQHRLLKKYNNLPISIYY